MRELMISGLLRRKLLAMTEKENRKLFAMTMVVLVLFFFSNIFAETDDSQLPFFIIDEEEVELTLPYSFSLPKNPTKAALLSAFVPGLGQIYNERYIKAGAVIGLQAYFVGRTFYHDRRMKDYRRRRNNFDPRVDPEYFQYDLLFRERYENRQSNLFRVGAVIFLSTMEAYVDAHLLNFNDKRNEIRLKFEDQMLQVSVSF